jgi:polysaccharide export outer membrane protein
VGVAGHTPSEVAQVLRQALAIDYLRDPRVDVRVEEYHAQKVFLYGQVARPGAYELRGETDVLKLLLDAGGPTRDANGTATLLRVRRGPRGEEVENRTIALDRLLGSGDLSQNAPVANGDVIFVAGGKDGGTQAGALDERAYYVLGEVKNPGSYRFKEGVTAMTAILEAGGFNEFARANKTKLVRGEKGSEQTRILKMGDVLEEGDRREDAKLQAGDVLVVPKSLF